MPAAEPCNPTSERTLNDWRARIESRLAEAFHSQADSERETEGKQGQLYAAMNYSLTGGGKRLRPLLVLAAAELASAPLERAEAVAVAVEMIHAYSLIHDDLPAMDDDDLRRGRPTCHLAFDEATAILAGDAMQAEAFHRLATLPHPDPARPLTMIRLLTRAVGPQGMAGGQALDLSLTGQAGSEAELSHLHQLKTGALIAAALQLGALAGEASAEGLIQPLGEIGEKIGLAFQIQDDVLDVTTETAILGKPHGADQARSQPTFTSLLGVETASQRFQILYEQAAEASNKLAGPDSPLSTLIKQMRERER